MSSSDIRPATFRFVSRRESAQHQIRSGPLCLTGPGSRGTFLLPMEQTAAAGVKEQVSRLVENIRSVIYVGDTTIEHLIAAKVAGGHVMLADSHGVGKTSLARALAGSFIWEERVDGDAVPFARIQCTVDLLPQDILGFSRFDGSSSNLTFYRGPIFRALR
jgi:MoxR-like ATPase